MNALPVYHEDRKPAWIGSVLFEEWFSTEFVPKIRTHLTHLKLPLKAILVNSVAMSEYDDYKSIIRSKEKETFEITMRCISNNKIIQLLLILSF